MNLRSLIPFAIVAAAFTTGVSLTHPISMGDTVVYVYSVAAKLDGRNYFFWDAGHLLWRPVGTIATVITRWIAGAGDPVYDSYRTLVALNLAAGLGTSLLLLATMQFLGVGVWIATFLTVAFQSTHGFLSYSQSGTSYIPGMFFLLGALYLAVRASSSRRAGMMAVLAGVSAATAVGLWLTYVFVLPSVAVAAWVFDEKRRLRAAVHVVAGAAATGIILFVGTALALGRTTPAEFIGWVGNADHDISGIGGIPSMGIGFGRSLLFVGDDGAVLRRFLLGDPVNPVSFLEAAATRVWWIGLVWLVGLAVFYRYVRERFNTRLLALFVATAAPVFAFAVYWQGGDIPRYFALFPALFLLLAVFLNHQKVGALRLVVALGLLGMAVNNVAGLSASKVNERRAAVVQRLDHLRGRARPNDFVFSSHGLDDVLRYANSRPFDLLVDDTPLQFRYLVLLGTSSVPNWRRDFARRVQRAWEQNQQIWIASRLLQPVPRPEWAWVEGTDPNIRWGDFAEFFGRFEYNDPMDLAGFVRIEGTEANLRRMQQFAE